VTEFKAAYLDFLISIVTTKITAPWYICCLKRGPKSQNLEILLVPEDKNIDHLQNIVAYI